MKRNINIGVIGMGYVGLPLSIELGKKYQTTGFDINKKRINELIEFRDTTNEAKRSDFIKSKKLKFTYKFDDLISCNFYIIAVPTPLNKKKEPDLNMLKNASSEVGKILKKDDIVVYESTVYPGLTEEVCVPILEKKSGYKLNKDFSVGYSPERINPGDKIRKLTDIKKIVSSSNRKSLKKINHIYSSIIKAGTFKAKSIKVAEAAKVIENSQRDINIAFMNELSLIFDKMNIDTMDVLEAAKTKWNFIPFYPGIVGGHCIGVDPYYLSYKASQLGYKSKIILSGRKLNDSMGQFIAKKTIELINRRNKSIKFNRVAILGLAFKENCNDIRNSKVSDIIDYLKKKKFEIDVYDPVVSKHEALAMYNIKLLDIKKLYSIKYDGIIIALKHNIFKSFKSSKLKNKKTVIFDVKSMFSKEKSSARL